MAYDLGAIQNSLFNLFNTLPGERVLLPDYGSDLRQYLFEPATQGTGRRIGSAIRTAIGKWEPRVTVTGVDITAYTESNEYDVAISLMYPAIKGSVQLTGTLNKNGFVFEGQQ